MWQHRALAHCLYYFFLRSYKWCLTGFRYFNSTFSVSTQMITLFSIHHYFRGARLRLFFWIVCWLQLRLGATPYNIWVFSLISFVLSSFEDVPRCYLLNRLFSKLWPEILATVNLHYFDFLSYLVPECKVLTFGDRLRDVVKFAKVIYAFSLRFENGLIQPMALSIDKRHLYKAFFLFLLLLLPVNTWMCPVAVNNFLYRWSSFLWSGSWRLRLIWVH
jgi:hypothetical protein